MPRTDTNDPTGKLIDIATKGMRFIADGVGDALHQVRSKVRSEHEAVQSITEMLTNPSSEDPLAMIREIEDRLGVDHHDWSKHGQWIGHSASSD